MNTTSRTNRSNQRLGGGTSRSVTRDSILVQGQKQRRRQRHATLKASSTSSCSSCPEDPVLVYPKGQQQEGQTRDDGIVMSSLVSESPGCHSFLSPRGPEQPPSSSGVGTKKQSLYRRYNCLAPRTGCAGPFLNGPLTGMEDEEYSTASSLGKINTKGILGCKDDKTKIISNTSPNSNTYCTSGMSSFLFPTNDENETQNSHKSFSKRRYTLQKSLSNRSSSKALLSSSSSSPQTPVTSNTNTKTRSFPDTFFHTPQDEFGFPTTTTTTNADQESPPSATTSSTSTTTSDDEPTLRIFPAVSQLASTLPKNSNKTTTTRPLQNSLKQQDNKLQHKHHHRAKSSSLSSSSRPSCWSSSGNTTVCSNDSSHSDDAFTELVTAARSPHRGAYSSYMMMDQWFYPDQDDDSAVSEFFGSNYF